MRLIGLSLLMAVRLEPAALAQSVPEEPVWPVGALELVYAESHPDHPALARLLPLEVELVDRGGFWSAPGEDVRGERLVFDARAPADPRLLDARAMVALLDAVVGRLHASGYYGIDVRPSSDDFNLVEERDLRPQERDALELVVRIGRIGLVRTIAAGDRIRGDWTIDNEIHDRIRARSPLQPAGSGAEGTTDLLDRSALEDYLHRLNRYSGRRVEAALSPAETPGEVVLDYRVLEAKPWFAYGQLSNTGTRRSNRWQARFGYAHRQLTNRDDTLSIEYLNAGGDDVNAVTARYQAPFFGPERPDWMTQRRGDPAWLEWIPRDAIPWWGVDRLRWEGEFSFSSSQAGEAATQLGIANDIVKSDELLFGGRLLYEIFQHKDFFIDLWGGLRLRDLNVRNRSQRTDGEALLVLPRIGVRASQQSLISALGLDVHIEGQVNHISDANLEALGRADTDDLYALLDFDLGYSTYLEPLLNPRGWRDPATQLSSALAHEIALGVRGQVALDDRRLIPQANGTLGGFYSVRGYPQSVAVGDTLVVSSFEYRFHLPRILPVSRKPLALPLIGDFRVTPQQIYGRPDWDLTLRAFVDFGHARRNDRNLRSAPFSLNERNQTLIGAGVGAELQIRSNIRARLDWAMALRDENVNTPRPTPPATTAKESGVDAGDSEIHVLFSILY
jgi:hypothetical protein